MSIKWERNDQGGGGRTVATLKKSMLSAERVVVNRSILANKVLQNKPLKGPGQEGKLSREIVKLRY